MALHSRHCRALLDDMCELVGEKEPACLRAGLIAPRTEVDVTIVCEGLSAKPTGKLIRRRPGVYTYAAEVIAKRALQFRSKSAIQNLTSPPTGCQPRFHIRGHSRRRRLRCGWVGGL